MKKNLFFILFMLCCGSLFAQPYTINGHVWQDPNGGVVDSSASPSTLPETSFQAILVETTGDTVALVALVDATTGVFTIPNVPAGQYYLMIQDGNLGVFPGSLPPAVAASQHDWYFTGESLLLSGVPDGTVDAKTSVFTLSSDTTARFGIQKKPIADNKVNYQIDNTSATSVPLSVNTTPAFTTGGSAVLSGVGQGGGSISNYTINMLPKFGNLYLGATLVTSLPQVDSLTTAQIATLSYQPLAAAQAQNIDFFTYQVYDNLWYKSNNATYVIPFQLLDGDGDTYTNRITAGDVDMDDDNDGITDLNECPLNNYGNLVAAYGAGEFITITPQMLGYPSNGTLQQGLDITKDISDQFGYAANSGAVIVHITNAAVAAAGNLFLDGERTGPTQWKIYGTVGTYAFPQQNTQYFSYDSLSITKLDANTDFQIPNQTIVDPVSGTHWMLGNDDYTWWIKSDTAARYTNVPVPHTPDPYLAYLNMVFTNPEPHYFQMFASSNNGGETPPYIVQILPECDDDMDGIPNRLDLDSDNDGCLDALEGSSTFAYTDVSPGGTATVQVGTGSTASNQNLCQSAACVDALGIPTVAGLGQTPVETYNAAVISAVCAVALPLKLISFDVFKKDNVAALAWVTASEQNNKGFEIERNTDGKSWTKIGFVAGQAPNSNGNIQHEYKLTDNAPAIGANYYRLKQLDFDGTFAYSPIRMANFGEENHVSIYPNPAKDDVSITGLQGRESIKVYDVLGRLVYQSNAGGTTVHISLGGLSEGVYAVHIIGRDGKVSSYKMVKNN